MNDYESVVCLCGVVGGAFTYTAVWITPSHTYILYVIILLMNEPQSLEHTFVAVKLFK